MTINERLFTLMKEKGIKAVDIAQKLNVNKTVISSWKSRKISPPTDYLVQICELLEVSLQYLLTGEDTDTTPDAEHGNQKELHLIEQYRKLNDRYQSKLVDTADDYVLLPGALRELNAESSGCKIS